MIHLVRRFDSFVASKKKDAALDWLPRLRASLTKRARTVIPKRGLDSQQKPCSGESQWGQVMGRLVYRTHELHSQTRSTTAVFFFPLSPRKGKKKDHYFWRDTALKYPDTATNLKEQKLLVSCCPDMVIRSSQRERMANSGSWTSQCYVAKG